jgi:hypothetical protein
MAGHMTSRQWRRLPHISRSLPDVQDILTEFNSPDGDCPICLLPLAGAAGAAEPVLATADQPVKLPCYHCLHRCDVDAIIVRVRVSPVP